MCLLAVVVTEDNNYSIIVLARSMPLRDGALLVHVRWLRLLLPALCKQEIFWRRLCLPTVLLFTVRLMSPRFSSVAKLPLAAACVLFFVPCSHSFVALFFLQ